MKPPKQTSYQLPPKQTSVPSGGFCWPNKGLAPHPTDGSQDVGTNPPASISLNMPKVGPTPKASPSDGSQDVSSKSKK